VFYIQIIFIRIQNGTCRRRHSLQQPFVLLNIKLDTVTFSTLVSKEKKLMSVFIESQRGELSRRLDLFAPHFKLMKHHYLKNRATSNFSQDKTGDGEELSVGFFALYTSSSLL